MSKETLSLEAALEIAKAHVDVDHDSKSKFNVTNTSKYAQKRMRNSKVSNGHTRISNRHIQISYKHTSFANRNVLPFESYRHTSLPITSCMSEASCRSVGFAFKDIYVGPPAGSFM